MSLAVGRAIHAPQHADRDVATLAMLISKHFRRRRVRVPTVRDEDLKGLTAPVLAIVGARDALLDSAATRRRLQRFAPRATVRLLPDAGHVVVNQTATVLDFLSG